MRIRLFSGPQVGDRPAVGNVAIVVSDGHSNINENNTIPEARLAKDSGIRILSVIVTDDYNQAEMTSIASSVDDVFLLTNATYMSSVVDAVLNRLC